MNAQMSFDDVAEVSDTAREALGDPAIWAKCYAMHRQHPELYDTFKIICYRLKRQGSTQLRARDIGGFMREPKYQLNLELDGGYKVSNWWPARWARWLVKEDPSFRNYFKFKMLGKDRSLESLPEDLEVTAADKESTMDLFKYWQDNELD